MGSRYKMNSQALCKCGHNFACHQLVTLTVDFDGVSIDKNLVQINKTETKCRFSEHSIPSCKCTKFVKQ